MNETPDQSPRRGRGRPPRATAESHAVILDAVYELLQDRSVRDLTIEAVATKAGVGKPTLYKWWPTKAALVMDMVQERIVPGETSPTVSTAEAFIRGKVRAAIVGFGGVFGKVLAELIAEGQSEPAVLREVYDRHIAPQRAETVAAIERGKLAGEFAAESDPEVLIDAIFGAIYYRLLLRSAALTEAFGEQVVDQVLRGVRPSASTERST